MSDPALDNALRLRRAGRLTEAAEIYSQILSANPRHFEALHALGLLRYQSGQINEAERLIGAAIAVEPRAAEAIYNRACLLQKLGRTDEAIDCFGRAIAAKPSYVEALTNRGAALMQLERYDEARADFDAVVSKVPGLFQAWNNRGSALAGLGRYDEAVESFDRAIALKSDYAEAWKNRGIAFLRRGHHAKALPDLDRAVALDPSSADAWEKRASALAQLSPAEAVASFDRALRIRPDHVDTLFRRAGALITLRRHVDAAEGYRRVLELDPKHEYARANLVFCHLNTCDWVSAGHERAKLAEDIAAGGIAISPFVSVALDIEPATRLAAARAFVAKECPATEPLWRGRLYHHDRIRVAYLSANFNDHAVARLIAGVFENHDKSKFETIGISFGADRGEMHARISRAFERFIDVRAQSDEEVAGLLHQMETDIAVDLMGFTEQCRPRILASRPAPVQVNYLGFAGTLGAEHIDYIIADRYVIPEDQRLYYAEQVVCLPDCYLPNDAKRRIAEPPPTRSEAGLPDDDFVFCSFNQTYKLTPELFDLWMSLLRAVDRSVLWLPDCAPLAVHNLRRRADTDGVDPRRLVFAPFASSVEGHLARLQLADLFLDTLPYNSHTSACDALFAGVPIVTCPGSQFAGRVAASALLAHGVPELIADSLVAYEDLALAIARDPNRASALKSKIREHRATHPLFDTARFTRHLESAFTRMWEHHRQGGRPHGFSVDPEPRRAPA
jgi:predicted O-linked N-acetylglucosamine transferase (SPINDLY family)